MQPAMLLRMPCAASVTAAPSTPNRTSTPDREMPTALLAIRMLAKISANRTTVTSTVCSDLLMRSDLSSRLVKRRMRKCVTISSSKKRPIPISHCFRPRLSTESTNSCSASSLLGTVSNTMLGIPFLLLDSCAAHLFFSIQYPAPKVTTEFSKMRCPFFRRYALFCAAVLKNPANFAILPVIQLVQNRILHGQTGESIMKTDVILIDGSEESFAQALRQTEAVARYRDLTKKQAMRLQLLAEEMTGMLRSIVGEAKADFWIESKGKDFELHLSALTRMDADKREALLKASTSGKNEAAKGFMGKLWDLVTQMSEPVFAHEPSVYDYGFVHTDSGAFDAPVGVGLHTAIGSWSLQNYKETIAANSEEAADAWDELEKSIVARLADEIRISINGNAVEMVIFKRFAPEADA